MSFLLLILAVWVFYVYYKKYERGRGGGNFRGGSFGRDLRGGFGGRNFDEARRRLNYYLTALLAKVAKSDGRVSEEEAGLISEMLDQNAKNKEERDFLKYAFNEHKNRSADAGELAREFLRELAPPRAERANILRIFVFMALIDGELSPAEREVLGAIAWAFELGREELDEIIASMSRLRSQRAGLGESEAWEILGLPPGSDLGAVKKKYRELAKRYHPDILNANKTSEEELARGVEKFQQVNEAYELLKKKLDKVA